MKIKSLSGELVAIVSRLNDITEKRNFYTENDAEMQFASFSLPKGENIKRHKHDKQERTVYSTSEGIVVLQGCIEVILYEAETEEFLEKVKLHTGDSIVMLSGGHEINLVDNSKFVEFKQGPYDEHLDKKLF